MLDTLTPYSIFHPSGIRAWLSQLAFRLRPARLSCMATNAHGGLIHKPRQRSEQDRTFVVCSRCGYSNHYDDGMRHSEWHSVTAGAGHYVLKPSGYELWTLSWYEGGVMARSEREAAQVFARERKLPAVAGVLVKQFTGLDARYATASLFTFSTSDTPID